MDAERGRATHGRAKVFGVEALVVEAVPGFVQNGEERVVEAARVIAGRDAAVTRTDTAAKRMGRDIEAAGFEIKANSCRCLFTKRLLSVHRILTFHNLTRCLTA